MSERARDAAGLAMNRTPHEPTDACWDQHCWSHDVDEPDEGAYLSCGECFHVYQTAGQLRRAYRREYWRVSAAFEDPMFRRIWRILTIRAKKIYFCQYCIHDF